MSSPIPGNEVPSERVGSLEPAEVLIDIDGPRLFVARTPVGEDLLVYQWAEEPGHLGWIAVPTDPRTIDLVRSGQAALLDALRQPWAWLVTQAFDGKIERVQQVRLDDLPAQDLPAPGVTLVVPEQPFLAVRPGRPPPLPPCRDLAGPPRRDIPCAMLARASFQNFKALKAVEVDLTPFTVLVGKNGSGKTSVLQAIHHASQVPIRRSNEKSVEDRLELIFSGSHDPRRLVTRPGHGPMKIALTDVEGATLGVEAQVTPDEEDQEHVRFVLGITGQEASTLTLPDDNPRARAFLASPALRRFGSAVFLRLDAAVMMKESAPSSEEPQLERNGEGLASVLSYLAGAAPEVLEAIRCDLTAIVPEVRGIRTFPARISRWRQQVVTAGDQAMYPTFEEQMMGHRFALDMGAGRTIPADMLSEGTVLALGLLTALRHPQCPRLVLMDDIDGALHSTAQAELVRCLRAVLASRPDVQIVCTSHSPYLLDHVAIEEVRIMALDREGHAHCRPLREHPDCEKWRKMLRTGEFWASVGEDWILEAPVDGR